MNPAPPAVAANDSHDGSAPSVRCTRRPPSALRGKRDAQFAQLIEPSKERIYRLALRITCNIEDAKDVQQGTMLKAYRKLGQFQGRSRFTTWISRIAINEALMCLRKRHSAVYVPLDQATVPAGAIHTRDRFQSVAEGPERAYARRELRVLLTRAIASLRPIYRAVFLLRGVERLSTKQTAKVLHISEGIVKTRIRRARKELRAYLGNALPGHMSPANGLVNMAGSGSTFGL
jgi:RNA polymerase sigma-70 factor (ECF subfamily)